MTQYPDPSQYPQNPGYPHQQPYAVPNYYRGVMPNPRPPSVTSVAIIGIVLGSLSVLCTGPGFLLNLAMLGNDGRNPLAPQLPLMNHSVVVLQTFQSLVNFVMAMIMLICCIAALRLKPFARKVLVPWSIFMIPWAVLCGIVTIAWVLPQTREATASIYRANPALRSAHEMGKTCGALLMPAVMCVVPLGVLIWWGRPHVRAAFGEQVALPPEPNPNPGPWPPPSGGPM